MTTAPPAYSGVVVNDEPKEVLRALWRVEGQELAEVDEDCGPQNQKACKNMKGVTFDGFAPAGSDLGTAWREKLQREGKLAQGSLRDLVMGEVTGEPGER